MGQLSRRDHIIARVLIKKKKAEELVTGVNMKTEAEGGKEL